MSQQQQQPKPAAPTAAQSAIVHVAQSAGLSALISLLIAIAQYLSTGNIDIHTLLSVLGGGFLTGLTMVYKSISSNPNLAQAALDTAQEALQKIEQLSPSWLNADIQKVTKSVTDQPRQAVQSVPKPIVLPPAQSAQPQQPTSGGGLPADYYSRFQQPRQNIPDMATQNVPAVNPGNSSMLGTYNLAQQSYNPVPPAQQSFPPQQGG